MKVYILTRSDVDYHENLGVFRTHLGASDYRDYLIRKSEDPDWENQLCIEVFELGRCEPWR